MATRIVDYLAAHPDRKLIVLIGRGHLEGGYGVPAFVSQKTDAAASSSFTPATRRKAPRTRAAASH